MEKNQIAEVIRKRLNLDDHDWTMIEQNPKYQHLFQHAIEASKYKLVAEVMFNTSGCFDTGPSCGGWGHVVVKMNAELIV